MRIHIIEKIYEHNKRKNMSSTIKNHDRSSYHLPRGYFKRRKPPDNKQEECESLICQPSSYKYRNSLRCRFSDKEFVNKNFLLLCTLSYTILTIMINGVAADDKLQNAIMENAFQTTPTPPSLPNDGICKSVDARFEIEKIHALSGCRVVEGSVTILLMDEIGTKDVANITFPELVEITGYLMLYRIAGFTSLNQLFPNLAVIRGKDLFKNYALIVYEMLDLLEVGLKNLLEVERGNVRIEKNEQMCFTHTIFWQKIITQYGDPFLEKNKLPSHCPNCPFDKCPKSIDGKTSYCWNVNHCQRLCTSCGAKSCSQNGTCCDKSCLGGCEDGNPQKCIACRKFSMGKYPDIKCVDQCPENSYAYIERRCLTRDECYDLNTSNPTDNSVSNTDHPFIPFDGNCIRECPPRYTKSGTEKQMTCKLCNQTCLKRCTVKNIVDSIETAQALKGCSIIDGPLEIQIRGTTKTPELGRNIVKELEASLSDIVEITEYLKIARSHPILSMSFLKNLKKIHGNRLESGKNALVVWENHNLQELWDESQKIEIPNGKLFFHFNPKLCFKKIENLANKTLPPNTNLSTIIENYETAKIFNGDKTPCDVTRLEVTVEHVYPQAALLSWDPLKLDDERSLLNYVVFYIAAPYRNVTLWDGRDACGNDGWNVEDVNDFSYSEKISQPLTKLEPYTNYAYYVKAYTLVRETGAQSHIQYFTTKPDMPDLVKKFKATAIGPDRIEVTWETLKKVNGRLKNYVLRAKAVDQNEDLRVQRDYCKEPLDTSITPQAPPKETTKDLSKIAIAPDGSCDCKSCSLRCDKQAPHNVEERQSANDFEDQIQDFVYVRIQENGMDFSKDRAKRQVSDEFPDRLSEAIPPHIDPEALKNSSDFFDNEIGPDQTSMIISIGLKHYTTYAISIRACREKEADENESAMTCGHEVNHYTTTFRAPSNDDIPRFTADEKSNGSNADILVKWDPPVYPNGLLLTYTIRYKRVDVDHTVPQTRCVSYNMLNNSNHFLIRGLSAGNYSIDVMATSLAGNGNYTKAQYVFIKEQGHLNMWYFILILLVIFVVCVVILAVILKRMYITSISSMKIIATVNPDYAGVTYRQDEWEIPRDQIIQLQELGCGSFGMVYEGIIKDFKRTGEENRCAIKTVNESATDKERASFLNEASVMKQFDTSHVVHLLGVVSLGQPIFVIMELMANGDLKGYLRSHRPEYDNGTEPPPQPPTLRRILQMGIEIADGMAYLSAKKFVHRDLAARNCMVAEDLTVKIGDFGMTRDIYETDYYRKGTKGLLPVRWMAPESLKDGVFTSSSDVFSYGVVVWEMATLASQPYQGLSNDQVLRYVIEGGVMERPENCPDKLYELMRRCWQHRPSARPSFMEIIGMLLDDVSSNFQNVSFYHSPIGQDIWHQMNQGELAVLVADDVTTPLRQDEEETSSIDGNHFLLEEVNSNHHRLDDL